VHHVVTSDRGTLAYGHGQNLSCHGHKSYYFREYEVSRDRLRTCEVVKGVEGVGRITGMMNGRERGACKTKEGVDGRFG